MSRRNRNEEGRRKDGYRGGGEGVGGQNMEFKAKCGVTLHYGEVAIVRSDKEFFICKRNHDYWKEKSQFHFLIH